jgi:hypothetical protein
MYGKQQWIGREVEGRYSDMMTFFVRELGNGIDVDDLHHFPHYYFTMEYVEKMLGLTLSDTLKGNHNTDKEYIAAIRGILDTTNCVVTIEANNKIIDCLPPDLFNRCHIIYRIIDTAVQKLKDTDTLSIDAGWYRCHMIAKMHLQETTPDNYKFDQI